MSFTRQGMRQGMKVPLPTMLQPGQSVTMRVSTHGLHAGALRVFGLPLAGIIGGAAVASIAGPSDAAAIVGSLCGLIIGLFAGLTEARRGDATFGSEITTIGTLDRDSGFVNNGPPCGASLRTMAWNDADGS